MTLFFAAGEIARHRHVPSAAEIEVEEWAAPNGS